MLWYRYAPITLILFLVTSNSALAAECKKTLFVKTTDSSNKAHKVPVTKQVPELTAHSEFIFSRHPGLQALSGNLVPRSKVPKEITYHGLFTCSSCKKHNSPMKPLADGTIPCVHCGTLKDASDGKYYRYPIDSKGRTLTNFIDAAQFADPEAAKAIMWSCDICRNDFIEVEHSICPTCAETPGSVKRRNDSAEVRKAAEELERVARKVKENNDPNFRAYSMGREAAERVLASKDQLVELSKRGLENLKNSPAFVVAHVKKLGAILGIGVAGAAAWYFFFDTSEYPGEVVATSWEHRVYYEELRIIPEEDWCDSLPSGAKNIKNLGKQRYSFKKYKRTFFSRLINSFWFLPLAFADKDNGNGTFTTEDGPSSSGRGGYSPGGSYGDGGYEYTPPPPPPKPVEKDMCSYDIERWVETRSEVLSGNNPRSSSELRWPGENTQAGERVGSRRSSYSQTVRYNRGDSEKITARPRSISQSDLFNFPVGTQGFANVNRVGSVLNFKLNSTAQ